MFYFLAFKAIIVKIKNFCIKYWEIFVGLILFCVGAMLGRTYSNSRVAKKDVDIIKNNNIKQEVAREKLTNDFVKDTNDLISNHKKNLDIIDKKKEELKEDLSNDNKKLDSILKNKFNLNKGE